MKRKPTMREIAWALCYSLIPIATVLVAIGWLPAVALAPICVAAVGLARVTQTR